MRLDEIAGPQAHSLPPPDATGCLKQIDQIFRTVMPGDAGRLALPLSKLDETVSNVGACRPLGWAVGGA
jgi:hypothetical protein